MRMQQVIEVTHRQRKKPHGLLSVGVVVVLTLCGSAEAQSLEQQLDRERFLQGLSELRLPEVLAEYIKAHPASNEVEEADYQIAGQKIIVHDPSKSAIDRETAAEVVLQIRRKIIADHPNDIRLCTWRAEQASDLFFVILPFEASGMTNLFGYPSKQQKDRANSVAAQMNELMAEAEIDIEDAILELESQPDYVNDFAAQMKKRRLVDEERDQRIPFLRGIGAFLDAELNVEDNGKKRELFELAAELLIDLAEILDGQAKHTAHLYGAMALSRIGEHYTANSLFKNIISQSKDSRIVLSALLASTQSLVIKDGSQAGLDALTTLSERPFAVKDIFLQILIADQKFLIKRKLAMQSGSQKKDELMKEAFRSYTQLLNRDLRVDRDTVQAVIFSRLTLAASDDNTPLDQLPALVSIARAKHLASKDDTRSQGIELFENTLARSDIPKSERAIAIFGLASAQYTNGQAEQAVKTFTLLAKEHATDRNAQRSIEIAAGIATDLFRQSPNDEQSRALLHETLDLLLSRYPNLPNIDQWRYTSGQLALVEEDYDVALELFGKITPDASQWTDAQFMKIKVLRSWAKRQERTVDKKDRYQQLLIVLPQVREKLIKSASTSNDKDKSQVLNRNILRLRIFEAEALLATNDPQEAAMVLTRIENEAAIDSTMLGEVLLIRIDAYYADGRSEDVPSELDSLIKLAPLEAGNILSNMLQARKLSVQELLEISLDEQAAEKATLELLPIARAIDRWLAGEGISLENDALNAPRLCAADGLRLSLKYSDALRLYDDLILSRPDAVEALFGQAECWINLGESHLANAMRTYRRITAAGEDGKYYWPSQLRMLQILDRIGRNTEKIAPRIRRLRKQDSTLGSERWRRGFEILQNKYS